MDSEGEAREIDGVGDVEGNGDGGADGELDCSGGVEICGVDEDKDDGNSSADGDLGCSKDGEINGVGEIERRCGGIEDPGEESRWTSPRRTLTMELPNPSQFEIAFCFPLLLSREEVDVFTGGRGGSAACFGPKCKWHG